MSFLSFPTCGSEEILLRENGIADEECINALAFVIRLYRMFMDDSDLKAGGFL